MTNPLIANRQESNNDRPWQIGETRTIHGKAKNGAEKTLVITRTDRDFVYDLCDASNAARSPRAREDGVEYYVVNGELRLGHSSQSMRDNARAVESRLETERARHNRLQLEAARSQNAYQTDKWEPVG